MKPKCLSCEPGCEDGWVAHVCEAYECPDGCEKADNDKFDTECLCPHHDVAYERDRGEQSIGETCGRIR